MTRTVSKENNIKYALSANDPWIDAIDPGEIVEVECAININDGTITHVGQQLTLDDVELPYVNGATGPIEASFSYDDFELVVDLRYQGMLPHIASDKKPTAEMVEEQSFAIGLSGFLSGVEADRIDRSAQGDSCRLRMMFDV